GATSASPNASRPSWSPGRPAPSTRTNGSIGIVCWPSAAGRRRIRPLRLAR
ncbi:unnamed protein product, partial [Prorocentrum cordatum]